MKHSALRALIIIIALTLALSSLGVSGTQRTADSRIINVPEVSERLSDNEAVDADTALKRLKDGNLRWQTTALCSGENCRGQTKMIPRNWAERRRELADKQNPFAVVLSCMDSRVPPELIFDQGLGDIFVIRVAGPVLDTDELASLEYAIVNIGVKLVVVLGHTDCGAVKGAVQDAQGIFLPTLLDKLEPAITWVSKKYNGGKRITAQKPKPTPEEQKNLDRVSLVNAGLVGAQIIEKRAWRDSGVQVKWGLYYLASGEVAFDLTKPVP